MKNFRTVLILALFCIFSSCKKDSNNPVSPDDNNTGGKISVGSTVDLTTQAIGSGGGTIKVNKTGDPLDGMEIIVEPNSFASTKNFKISYAEIKSHQFGQYFNPISPLIKISYEGGYSDQPMEVKVPIKLPAGYFAMGFFYDEKTGTLEGLPVDTLDNNFIKVSTRHFGSSSSTLGKANGLNDGVCMAEMIITSIDESVLKSQTVIASGFKSGEDDWEFINWGSYIALHGHCAGQSMTAMWYYYEKHLKGEQSLFHKYDTFNDKTKPDSLWQDNPYGYRYASTIQKDFHWDDWSDNLDFKATIPKLNFNSFALSILLTGEPQFVLIKNSHGLGAHAMIVTKVNYNEGKLYIADPNYPNNRAPKDGSESIRVIELINNQFKAYETGLNAGAESITMDKIGYFGKTAYIEWGQMGKRWTEFENKTIGNDRFPTYELMFKDGESALPIQDNMIYEDDSIKVYSRSVGCDGMLSGTNNKQPMEIFGEKGNEIPAILSSGYYKFKLNPGLNKIGFCLSGFNLDLRARYMDFKWFNIYYYSLKIYPDPIVSKKNVEVTLTAKMKGMKPNPFKIIWNFGDGTSESTVNNDSTVKYTFSTEGTFNVHAKLYDGSNNIIAEAYATANIQSDTKVAITSIYPVSSLPGLTMKVKGTWAKQSPPANSYFKINDQRVDPINNNWSGEQVELNVPQSTATGMGNIKVVYSGVESDPYNYYFGIPVDSIKTANVVRYKYSIWLNCENGSTSTLLGLWPSSDLSYVPFTWQGSTFSATYEKYSITSKITGTISNDGMYITSLKLEHTVTDGTNVVLQLKLGSKINLDKGYYDNYVNVFSYSTTKHFPLPMYLIEKEELISNFDATGVIHTSSGGDYQVKSIALKNGETSYSNFPIWFEKE